MTLTGIIPALHHIPIIRVTLPTFRVGYLGVPELVEGGLGLLEFLGVHHLVAGEDFDGVVPDDALQVGPHLLLLELDGLHDTLDIEAELALDDLGARVG